MPPSSSTVKIYVASKSRHWPWWAALRAMGLDIRASWIDWEPNHTGEEPDAGQWGQHWLRCCREAANCDILLLLALPDERQNGALVELGCALGAGRKVFLVSPFDWSWRHHPLVTIFPTLADAIEAIRKLDAQKCKRKQAA